MKETRLALTGASRREHVRTFLFHLCPTCKGDGQVDAPQERCPICELRKDGIDPNCPICMGTDKAPIHQIDCPECLGQGRIVHRENAELIRDAMIAIGFPPTPYDGRVG